MGSAIELQVLQLVFFAKLGGGYADVFTKHTVELGKAVKPAGGADLCDGDLGIDQQGLHIPDSCHLDIVRNGKTGDQLELVGEIAAADTEFFRQ